MKLNLSLRLLSKLTELSFSPETCMGMGSFAMRRAAAATAAGAGLEAEFTDTSPSIILSIGVARPTWSFSQPMP